MNKPRVSPSRELFGILGSYPHASALQKEWNAFFTKQGMDAFCDRYPTKEDHLPERLSEMFHFDRRAYIIGPKLQHPILPLLDVLDASAKQKVNMVLNRGGVLTGFLLEDVKPECVDTILKMNN
ncbi:hypothetical protein COU76_01180 [Candidatus Peregrinibacteria bacterium CG10_big_fil_rev_8_21_14_0_10_49_10]|nr:MAG: hypothetical protein COU76_01180 [Candidatus Peregrinibacteria bacterium CG10_big_fil_rev_8_21_14_0_10_49_10]